MNPQTGSQTAQPTQSRRDTAGLDRQYGDIGISAVAAALQYAGTGKNPAYAPVVPLPTERFADAAA